MGYTKIYQYGNITEIYQYKKDLIKNTNKQSHATHQRIIDRKRGNATKVLNKKSVKTRAKTFRTIRSIKRAKKNFFRLCHANNIKAKTIHFLTLTLATNTDYSTCLRYISRFFNQLKKEHESKGYKKINYIAVPELTKKETYHFHLLVYDLPPEFSISERETRYIQRQWGRGYVDIRLADRVTTGIAGYMAKYMAKYLAHGANEARRAYNCSRGIEKIRSVGSNSLFEELEEYIPDKLAERKVTFEVPFLGTCQYSKYQVISKPA